MAFNILESLSSGAGLGLPFNFWADDPLDAVGDAARNVVDFFNPFDSGGSTVSLGEQFPGRGPFGGGGAPQNFGGGGGNRIRIPSYTTQPTDVVPGAYGAVQGAISRGRAAQQAAILDQLRNLGKGGGGGGSGVINKRIARAREELASGNEAFDDYFEAIGPGFEEAVEQAKRIAEAEAAIEGHFTGTQEAIDTRYADAEGGVRAIADQAGNLNAALGEAIHNSVYEFKEFIDKDLHTSKEGAQKMNAAASALAVAASEMGAAASEGEGKRGQFEFQRKYEKIIQALLDQRAAAAAARGRAMSNAKQQLVGQLRALSQSTPYSRGDIDWFVRGQMLQEAEVPAAFTSRILDFQNDLQEFGYTRVNEYRNAILAQTMDGIMPPQYDQMFRILAPYTEVIEMGISDMTRLQIDDLYSETFNAPQTDFDFFNVGRQEAYLGGLQGDEAAAFGNFYMSDQRGDFNDFNFDDFDINALLGGF